MKCNDTVDPLTIVGFINSHQINVIEVISSTLVELGRPLNFLELGPGVGRSTTAWINHLPKVVDMHVLDSWMLTSENFSILESLLQSKNYFLNFNENDFNKTIKFLKKHGQFKLWQKNIQDNPNKHKIKKIYTIDFMDFLKSNKEHYDCVYIDMLDSEEEIINCFNYFGDSVLICGDDYMSERHPYVTRAVHRFIEQSLVNKNQKHLYVFPEANFYAITSIELSVHIRERLTGK